MRQILLLALFLTGCETTSTGTRQLTPQARQILTDTGKVVLDAAIQAGLNAATQYASGGKVDGGQVAAAGINGAANGLRTLGSNPSPDQINTALVTFSGDPRLAAQLAPAVSGAVTTAVSQGVPATVAVENAAVQLDSAAAKVGK